MYKKTLIPLLAECKFIHIPIALQYILQQSVLLLKMGNTFGSDGLCGKKKWISFYRYYFMMKKFVNII